MILDIHQEQNQRMKYKNFVRNDLNFGITWIDPFLHEVMLKWYDQHIDIIGNQYR